MNSFSREFGINHHLHLMYSGIPNHQKLGTIKEKVRRFLFIGRVIKSKNIHHFIQSISILPKTMRDNIYVEVIGDGDYKEELMKLTRTYGLSNVVRFLPKIKHKDVFSKMNQFDALVMVSKETFGMVYVEAMSQGCIVVAAQGEGVDGLVVNNKNGYLVEVNNIIKLSETIRSLYELDSLKVRQLSENAILTAESMKNEKLASNLIEKLF